MAENQGDQGLTLRERFRLFTPMVAFITIYMALCAFNFGFDVGNFAGVQAMQPFAMKFGEWNEQKHMWALPSYLSSIMTATPFFGKLIGAIACGRVAERWGRKRAIMILALISLVGVTLQTSATTAAQFTVGRIVNFAMTGFCIVVVPIYQAECAPKDLRGLINSTIQMIIIFGQTVASLVNFGTQHMTSDASWLIPVGLQFVVPVLLLALLPLVPESPRWLLSKDRPEDAKKSLIRLRGQNTSEEMIQAEIDGLRHATANSGKGTWKEVFDTHNRRRTVVAIIAMFGQQITGQAFVNQYSTIFYQQNGFVDQAFLFTLLANVAGVVGTAMTWFVVDGFGRRPILFFGGFLMGAFLYIVAIISTVPNPTMAAKNTMVASLTLFSCMYCVSWGPISYVVLGESASARVKEKTSLLACCISILTTFVTSFTLPYLLNPPYAALGGKVGFVYGSICFAFVVVTFFFVPELKGRSLEEVDQLFAMDIPLWKFKGTKTVPVEELAAGVDRKDDSSFKHVDD
ncbi:general substrate transporter [Hypomontagnella monticulosa]|nr:general substrate transporter [Hypomontagnella monticulosa]